MRVRVCAFAFALALPLSAQMSMEQFAAFALENNREMRALRQRLPETRGLRRQAGLAPNPTLDVSAGNGAIVRNSGYWDGAVGYSQLIELGGKRQKRGEAAEAVVRATDWEIQEKERLLRADVQAAYVEALAAARNLATAEELLRLAEQSATVVEARVQQGEAAALDLSLIRVELGRLRTDRVLFTNQHGRALASLRAMAGMDPADSVQLASTLELTAPAVAEVDALVRNAMANRPDVQLLRQLETVGDAAIRLEKSSAVPNLTASARFAYTYDFIQHVPTGAAHSVAIVDRCPIVTVGVSVDLPWRNRNQGNIDAAVARRQSARLRREHQERAVTAETRSALTRWETGQAAVRLFEAQVLSQAQDNLRIVRGVYEHGELRLLDMINEQRKLTEAQRTYTELLKERYAALIELEKSAGISIPRGK